MIAGYIGLQLREWDDLPLSNAYEEGRAEEAVGLTFQTQYRGYSPRGMRSWGSQSGCRSKTTSHLCNCDDFRNMLKAYYMMQGCHTPPPPPTPWYPPLPGKWVVFSFGLVAFPVWSCLASSLPPLWSGVGPVVFLVSPAPPVGGSVFYRGMVWYVCCRLLVIMFYIDMVWLLPHVSCNVIVTCSLPYKI